MLERLSNGDVREEDCSQFQHRFSLFYDHKVFLSTPKEAVLAKVQVTNEQSDSTTIDIMLFL